MAKKEWIGIELFLRVLFKAILLKELGTGLLHYFLRKFVWNVQTYDVEDTAAIETCGSEERGTPKI